MAPGPNGASPSSFKSYSVTSVSGNELTIAGHNIATGEKIILNSESGDLPENVTPHIVYYAIRTAGDKIKLATSETNALNGEALTIYGGTSLVVKSRVSDKNSGELGSPIQWDSAQSNWYIWVDSTNTIYGAIVANQTELINDNQGATDLASPLSSPLTIGIIPTIGPYLLPLVLPKLKKYHPNLNLKILEGKSSSLVQKVNDGDLDR